MKEFRYSALDTAQRCLHKYNMLYLQGYKHATESGDMHFGTAMHLGIQSHFEGEDAITQFRVYWESIKGHPLITYARYQWKDYANLGEVFLARWVRLHSKKYKLFKSEERIHMKIGEFKYAGTPDFIGYYEDEPAIVDFKTSASEYSVDKLLSNEQLWSYVPLARSLGFDPKVLRYVVFVKGAERIQTNVKIVLTEEMLSSKLENMKMQMRDLSTRSEFPKNPSGCFMGTHRCELFSNCFQGENK